MTKTNIIGTESVADKKKIEFVKSISRSQSIIDASTTSPSHWDNIVLLEIKGYDYHRDGFNNELDAMYAYNNGREQHGTIYLGHWNDGVV